MPTYVIDGKRYSSPTPLSEDDLLELSGGSKAPAAPTEQPSTLQKIGRTADDLVRAAANGITFGWADRLAASGDAALGKGDYASNVKQERQLSEDAQKRNPYVYKGVEIGSGLVVPGLGLVKGATTGAKVANAAANGAIYGGLSGSGEASGDTDVLQAAKNTGTGAAIGATIGTVATPVINKGLELASRFSPTVDKALTRGEINRNFTNNPTANVDAEITRDLGVMRGGKSSDLKAVEMNDLQGRYIDQVKQLAKNAGVLGDVENLSIDRFRSLLADPESLAKLQSTKEGQAILDNLNKANRVYELTQAAESNNGVIPKLSRTFVDSGILDATIMGTTGVPIPVATAARQGIKKALGGNSTRQEVAAGLVTERGQKAANQFLEEAGPSNATKGVGILKEMADDRLAQDMAIGREAAVSKRTAMEQAMAKADQLAAEKAAKEAEKNAIREGGQIIKERQAAEALVAPKKVVDPNQSISELQATDPTYLLGLSNPNGVPRNAQQMQEFSSVIKAQMENAAKEAAAKEAAAAEAKAGILGGVKEKLGVTNRSGVLRNFEDGFGLAPNEVDDVLKKLATDHPETADLVSSLYKSGARLSSQELRDLSDIIASQTGKRFNVGSQGILNQSAPGALSSGSGNNVSSLIYSLPDDQISQLIGRNADTLGKDIGNARGYLTTRASRALETFNKAPDMVPEADKALLQALGLI